MLVSKMQPLASRLPLVITGYELLNVPLVVQFRGEQSIRRHVKDCNKCVCVYVMRCLTKLTTVHMDIFRVGGAFKLLRALRPNSYLFL